MCFVSELTNQFAGFQLGKWKYKIVSDTAGKIGLEVIDIEVS